MWGMRLMSLFIVRFFLRPLAAPVCERTQGDHAKVDAPSAKLEPLRPRRTASVPQGYEGEIPYQMGTYHCPLISWGAPQRLSVVGIFAYLSAACDDVYPMTFILPQYRLYLPRPSHSSQYPGEHPG